MKVGNFDPYTITIAEFKNWRESFIIIVPEYGAKYSKVYSPSARGSNGSDAWSCPLELRNEDIKELDNEQREKSRKHHFSNISRICEFLNSK